MSTTYKLALGASVGVTTLIGLFSVMPGVLAATSSSSKNAVVTVGASCSMNSTVSTAHTATIAQGNYNKGIGLTEVTTTCNDAGGYAIYAVGYGDDTLGNNVLHSATVGSTYDIATGNDFANATTSYSSNTSEWAMRVETVPGQTDSPTITNNFDSLSLVPTTYTKVAQYNANTSTPSTSSITTEYGAYIAIGQPAGTYTGKVKYTLVHPSTEPAPVDLPSPPTSCNTPVPGNYTYLQDINASNKVSVLSSLTTGTAYYLRDSRDEEPYCIAKLADGNLWFLDNLRLDLSNSTIIANTTASNTNASVTALNYLKNGGGTTSDQWPTARINNVPWVDQNQNFFSIPMAVASGTCNDDTPYYCANDPEQNMWTKDSTPKNHNEEVIYGNGSGKIGVYYNYCAASAGTYCYGNGSDETGSPSSDPKSNTNYDIDGDICPANWRMPTGDNGGEYEALCTIYNGGSSCGWETEMNPLDVGSFQHNLSLSPSGTYGDDEWYTGGAAQQGADGRWWTSTWQQDDSMYHVSAGGRMVYSADVSYWRLVGLSVRCILK